MALLVIIGGYTAARDSTGLCMQEFDLGCCLMSARTFLRTRNNEKLVKLFFSVKFQYQEFPDNRKITKRMQ